MVRFKIDNFAILAFLRTTSAEATVTVPISTLSSSSLASSYEATPTPNVNDMSTLPDVVCPQAFHANSSYQNGSHGNYTVCHGSAPVPLATLVSTPTEISTINPLAVTETITAISTISDWYTTTETDEGHNTTISYIEIVSYSPLSTETTTFLAPQTPIVYTVTHALSSTMPAKETPASVHRRQFPFDVRNAVVNGSSPSLASNNSGSTGNFSAAVAAAADATATTTYPGIHSIASASLSLLPVWTNTMGSSHSMTAAATAVDSIGIPITTGLGGSTDLTSSAAIFTTNANSSNVQSSQTSTLQPEHKSPGSIAGWDYMAASVVAILLVFFF